CGEIHQRRSEAGRRTHAPALTVPAGREVQGQRQYRRRDELRLCGGAVEPPPLTTENTELFPAERSVSSEAVAAKRVRVCVYHSTAEDSGRHRLDGGHSLL